LLQRNLFQYRQLQSLAIYDRGLLKFLDYWDEVEMLSLILLNSVFLTKFLTFKIKKSFKKM